MKKLLLITLALVFTAGVFAQQRNYSNVTKKEVRPIDAGKSYFEPASASNTQFENAGVLYNRSGTLLKTDVSSSSNLFGIFTMDQRVVSAIPGANMAVFGNRAGGSFGATGNDLRIAYSTDLGATFTNFLISPQTDLMFRYPSNIVYNPAGNTDPNNMFAIYAGPYTVTAGWKGQFFGSARIGGTDKFTTYEDNEPTVYINHMNIGLTATPSGNIHVCSSRLNGTSTAYTSEGWEVLNGVFNSATSQVDWELPRVKVQPVALDDNRVDASDMVFSPDGSVGYLFGTAVDADLAYNPYGVEWPVIYKTTDNGVNWDKIETFDFSEINTFYEYLWPTRSDLNKVVPRWYNKWASPDNQTNNGATVDKNGNLHIAGLVRSTNSLHPDSLNYFYTEEPLLIFDVFMNGDGTWNAQFVDSIRSEGLETYLTVSLDQRISMSRTEDGSKIFVSWADTDPALWGAGVTTNTQPDVFIWGRDVVSNLYTNPVNVTALSDYWGDNFWFHAGDQVLTEGSDYFIPISTSVNGATENDPVLHKYFSGPGFNEGEFVNPGVGNLNVPSKVLNVSQNYPNPFNGVSRVDVSLSAPANVSIEVTNLIGQKVYELAGRNLGAGPHALYLNSNNIKPGIYLYSVIANGERVTRKMVVR